MSIISKFKRLFFGAEAAPEMLAPQPVSNSRQEEFANASGNETAFSESEVSVVRQRAEALQQAFNESLYAANQSKNRETRERKLQMAREGLIDLKRLANKFPFLRLTNLQAVEACITGVEAETRSLPSDDVTDFSVKDVPEQANPQSLALQGSEIVSPQRNEQDRQPLGASDEQGILMCIQSCFRVVNESIDIARKSKNLETKMSRLAVARNSLNEARKQASQFALKVEGFDEAEAEINRIDEAIRAGTPTEIAGMQHIDVNAEFSSRARDLLKEATALKREKKYIEACDKLREAYSADGAENLMIEDRLRLPMYLQLAGKNDAGWAELNRLVTRYVDQFSQPRIDHQMNIFLRKENNESALNPVRVILRGENKHSEAVSEQNSVKMGELQNAPMPSWMLDVSLGFQFCATLQLRTPLRVLLRHGELYLRNDGGQPHIAHEPWEGIWLPKTKTFV